MLRQRFAEGTAPCAWGLGDRAFIVIDRQEKAQTPLAIGKAYKSELGRVNECF